MSSPVRFGDRSVIVPVVGDAAEVASTAIRLATALGASTDDVVVRPGMSAVLVEARAPDSALLAHVEEACMHALATKTGGEIASAPREHELVVRYDGEDLADVAALLGLGEDQLVRAHGDQLWSVAMMGFAPGFGYLVPVAPVTARWDLVERRPVPRRVVPAGSVAVAAGMSAVYPRAMPGGWQLLGTCAEPLFDPMRGEDASLLRPGARVRFVRDGHDSGAGKS